MLCVKDCTHDKITGTQACRQHQSEWNAFQREHKRQGLPGAWKIHRQHQIGPNQTRHDESESEEEATHLKNYFTPKRFYCVETICAPCGMIIAWAKFDRAESPTNILQFLADVYPNEQSRPDYICIDKACLVLRTAVRNNSWTEWKKTTRFIVDVFHYTNHRKDDYLCRKYCNPAPLNGSAPNLVVVATDSQGHRYYKRAFNTQACEQLNAWLGGFESILRRMTIHNFNWFLHTMLVYHAQYTAKKIAAKEARSNGVNNPETNDEEADSDSDNEVML